MVTRTTASTAKARDILASSICVEMLLPAALLNILNVARDLKTVQRAPACQDAQNQHVERALWDLLAHVLDIDGLCQRANFCQ
jgi:hypothetical protein